MGLQQIPYDDPITNRETGRITRLWTRWFSLLVERLNISSERIANVVLPGQTASQATTPFGVGLIPPGIYRLAYNLRRTSAADVGDITVTFGWTDGVTPAPTFTFPTFDGNTAVTTDSGILHARVEANATLTYSYVVTGSIEFTIDFTIESVSI